jgi:hypothetical protein
MSESMTMRTKADLVAAIRDNYAAIMDADRNLLRVLPPAQRFQTMVYLSVMWTTIFCAAFGSWYWYGELIVGHLLFVLGIALTTITFSRAARQVKVPFVKP